MLSAPSSVISRAERHRRVQDAISEFLPRGMSRGLYHLLKNQHFFLPQYAREMAPGTEAEYKKTDDNILWILPAIMRSKSNSIGRAGIDRVGIDRAGIGRVGIGSEKELAMALDPNVFGPRFRPQRKKEIALWIEALRFTADALAAGNDRVLNRGRDRQHLFGFIAQQKGYSMLQKDSVSLSEEQAAFKKAFYRLMEVMESRGLMDSFNAFYR